MASGVKISIRLDSCTFYSPLCHGEYKVCDASRHFKKYDLLSCFSYFYDVSQDVYPQSTLHTQL